MGKTPGQAAHEARLAAKAKRLGIELPALWDELNDGNRDDWEAAAQAVLNQAFPGLRQEIADLKRERDGLRELLNEARIAEPVAAPRDSAAPELGAAHNRAAWLERELNKSIDEIALLRALVAEILGRFGPTGSGMSARVGQVQIAKWGARAGLGEGNGT